jgi:NAD(P)-dependent dehydrogenase (short-subunit alcohol dehydrogenase family)
VPTTDPISVVVGAASGIGAAVAARLALRGPLIVADRDLAGAEAVAAELGEHTRAVMCDVTDADQVRRLAANVTRLGALVVTAGVSPSTADPERIFEVSLVGRTRVVEAFEPKVASGSVAIVLSAAAAHAVPTVPVIAALLDAPFERNIHEALVARGLDSTDPRIAYAFANHGMIRLVRRRADGSDRGTPLAVHLRSRQQQPARAGGEPRRDRRSDRVPHEPGGVVHDRDRRAD